MARNGRESLSKPLAPLPIRFVRLHARLVVSAVVGIVVIAALRSFDLRIPTKLLIGWNVGIALYLSLVHTTMARCDINHIRRRAAEQDEGALLILLLTMAATFASLVAIIFELGGSKQLAHSGSMGPVLQAVLTIFLSWSFVHTIFALHYAHEYYGERRGKPIGGLNFPGDKEPDYWDFLYFSLVIGMTSQVSDVAITNKNIRRLAAVHGALSFFFNLTILALTVNMVSNLI